MDNLKRAPARKRAEFFTGVDAADQIRARLCTRLVVAFEDFAVQLDTVDDRPWRIAERVQRFDAGVQAVLTEDQFAAHTMRLTNLDQAIVTEAELAAFFGKVPADQFLLCYTHNIQGAPIARSGASRGSQTRGALCLCLPRLWFHNCPPMPPRLSIFALAHQLKPEVEGSVIAERLARGLVELANIQWC